MAVIEIVNEWSYFSGSPDKPRRYQFELDLSGDSEANVFNRQFNPHAPNKAYVSDITHTRTGAGRLYLAVVLDLFAHTAVGWAMAPSMAADLVCEALRMPIQQRQPGPSLIAHSDRGSQYPSKLYQDL